MREIEELAEFRGRAPGSDAERRAASHLEKRLTDLGRDVTSETIDVHPRIHLTYALHALVAIVGSVLSTSHPFIGLGVIVLALILTFLDAAGLLITTRRLLGRRTSQNVISREGSGKPGTLVLVAHMDAGRQGAAHGRFFQERRATLSKLLRRPVGPLTPVMASMLVILICALLRAIGMDNMLVTFFQFIPTVVLILVVPLLVDAAISDVSPGANDNASGVALALGQAERFGGALDHFDVWVLLAGGNECGAQGTRAFLKRHKAELAKESTVFLNLDEVGSGTVRWTEKEGLAYLVRSHVQLTQICSDIAEDDEETNAFGARSFVSRTISDGYAARVASYPAVTITCRNALDYVPLHHSAQDTPEHIDADAFERARGFTAELIERLDAEIGPELDDSKGSVLSEAESS